MITTEGDVHPPDTAWGEGAFVTAIEEALIHGRIDIAVHSAKDLPTDERPELEIGAYLPREAPGDVLVFRAGGPAASSLDEVERGARVGTDSPRRTAFLRAVRPDLRFHQLHGNVDTRLRRLDERQTDLLVLAEAGLSRLGRSDRVSVRLPAELVPPAPGQGALAVQVRAGDADVRRSVAVLDDRVTHRAVAIERAILAGTGGGCRAPVGAVATIDEEGIRVVAGFARPDGGLRAIVERRTTADPDGHDADDRLVAGVLADLVRDASAAARRAGDPRILVTRAAAQAAPLALALVDQGLAPILVPAIEIVDADGGPLADAAARLADFDWVLVTSINAADAIGRLVAAKRGPAGSPGAAGPHWAAVGSATSRALRARGIRVSFQPRQAAAAALVATVPIAAGDRVLLPRSDIADPGLVDGLRERGAIVESVVAYRTIEAPESSVPLLGEAIGHGLAATILSSGSTARGLVSLAARVEGGSRILALPTVCIGPETAGEARRLGYRIEDVSASPAPRSIAEITARLLARQTDRETTDAD